MPFDPVTVSRPVVVSLSLLQIASAGGEKRVRWLGIGAAVATLVAAVLNVIWFSRHILPFREFVAVVWPAALATVGILGGAVVIGIVTVRLMIRADEKRDAE